MNVYRVTGPTGGPEGLRSARLDTPTDRQFPGRWPLSKLPLCFESASFASAAPVSEQASILTIHDLESPSSFRGEITVLEELSAGGLHISFVAACRSVTAVTLTSSSVRCFNSRRTS